MKSIKIAAIMLVAFQMVGCSSSSVQFLKPTPPSSLLIPCEPIEDPKLANLGDLMLFTNKLAYQYGECRSKQVKLSDYLKN